MDIPWKYDAGSNRTYVYDCICMYITNNIIDLYYFRLKNVEKSF